ncbi:Protein phosphatase 2C PP2C-like domain-containing protein [Cinnamomum micranthum f. kanehirae]|uniref:Protein phosphatase 2C PP2C-like domain-containing protein n=1 Tax=Cinnamomum micranthum f. kanehirae TaxID=337451 RepID=A0A3S3R2R2_9MAGN|nr:Protein phosphatase 2C PP2C-like domain-containing protein [Cinnamomum micranthum f. kanehirae]
MGNSTSRVVECFVPVGNGKHEVDLDFLKPLDEGLGHSFCYVRRVITDSPAITPSNSERFTLYSSTLDSETQSGSFRRETIEDSLGLQRPSKNFTETTFKTISGASVSANVSTARSANQAMLFATEAQEPAASFESTSSFAAIPLQPVPRGSGPLNGFMSGPLERGFASGPLERGFASGPLERGGGFMSGPIEKGVFMSGPLDSMDKTNFSAPLVYSRKRAGLGRLVRSVSRPVRYAISHTFSRRSSASGWMQRHFLHPMTQFGWHPKEAKFRPEVPRNCFEVGQSLAEYSNTRNLQWAHGKAGEDRVHVVLSEEQGWLFVGIYDGFTGPDAPDFLMSYLYRAIDKELEGLLWDYEDKPPTSHAESAFPENDGVGNMSESIKNDALISGLSEGVAYDGVEEPCAAGNVDIQSNEDGNDKQLENASASKSVEAGEIVEEKDDDTYDCLLGSANETNQDLCADLSIRNPDVVGPSVPSKQVAFHVTAEKLAGQGRKSRRLYELLQMEDAEIQESASLHVQLGEEDSNPTERLTVAQAQPMVCTASTSGNSSSHMEKEVRSREDEGVIGEESKHSVSFSAVEHKKMRKSLIGSKLIKMYRKQKSLRKKLFPWSYDWHRDETRSDATIVDSSIPIRRCKSGPVDHSAVLNAMSRALELTEEAYMEMVENSLDINPELALMGSCVLVMLMKDQDVYVMNLGDSRVILAQERLNDHHANPSAAKDDAWNRNRSRESLVRVELDRISEESPMHHQTIAMSKINKSQDISICRLKMRAIQLSTDHSTSVGEEILRIKAEHADDSQAILNDRVKGQLKVTRAFGAGFLKKPKCNEALLEIFRIDYIGTSPYVSCIPSVLHHRLSSNDRFLVLSSDGLYQYFSNEEVVSYVAWFMENVPEGDPAQYLIAELLFRAAKKNGMDFHELLDIPHGDRRKYHDDVSVMVISLEGRIWRSSG